MILVDSNIFIDLATRDPVWGDWSRQMLAQAAESEELAINPIIFTEVSVRFPAIEKLDAALPEADFRRLSLPYAAGFLAGRVFVEYRRRGGARTSPLPDFYIGAHAAIEKHGVLTRDSRRYESYFPTVRLIAP